MFDLLRSLEDTALSQLISLFCIACMFAQKYVKTKTHANVCFTLNAHITIHLKLWHLTVEKLFEVHV